jgi:low temperature requirement protein LtrA
VVNVPRPRRPRISAEMREDERVRFLELFFDLVFVLALTQVTAAMADEPTWEGLAKGVLVMGILWWAWVGYAWLTSVINPEEGAVRVVFFVAMAAFLVAALCVPEAFSDLGLTFAIAYGVVRVCHIFLFVLASADDPEFRRSVIGLAVSTAIGVGLLATAATLDGWEQGALWALALALDAGGPFFFGAAGWKLAPEHFAERHGLILIVALGESIVAIGAGVETGVDAGVVAAAVVGIGIAASQWWIYFDLTQIASARRLAAMDAGRERNELARDSYSYLHFLMVAGIVLVALGMKKTIGDVGEPLEDMPAFALTGGAALYLFGLVAFRYRHIRTVSRRRLVAGLLCLAVYPLALELPAIASVGIVFLIMAGLVVLDTRSYGKRRYELRHGLITAAGEQSAEPEPTSPTAPAG